MLQTFACVTGVCVTFVYVGKLEFYFLSWFLDIPTETNGPRGFLRIFYTYLRRVWVTGASSSLLFYIFIFGFGAETTDGRTN